LFNSHIKDALLARLDKLTPESKARWGRMDVTQMLTHMNDAFRISLGMKPAIDKSNFFTNKIMFPAAVYIVPRWPQGAATAIEMQQGKEGSVPRDFYTEVEFLKKMFDVFNEREEPKLKPHPIFGKLSKKQWADLFAKHLDHHLRQFGV
jgi:hypothetical protein